MKLQSSDSSAVTTKLLLFQLHTLEVTIKMTTHCDNYNDHE